MISFDDILNLTAAIFAAMLIPSLLYWAAALLRIASMNRSVAPVETGHAADPPGDGWPSVTVIIPAHDEEKFIGDALDHLLESTYSPLSIIVIADRCADATAERVRERAARDPRVRLIEIDHCPEGWSGKCHASWTGAQAAGGEWLIFTDADTVFAPDLIRASLGYAIDRRFDFLSLLGRLRQERPFEKTAQPVAAMALMKMYPLDRANRDDSEARRPFANGQFMLIRRHAYDEIGGHAAVRDAILEDLRFARRLTRRGHRIGVTLAGDRFRVRMYETADEFRRGWKRIFIEAANRNVPRLSRTSWRLRWLGASTALNLVALVWAAVLLALKSSEWMGPSLLALALLTNLLQFAAVSWAYRLQGISASAIWRFPSGCFRVASIFSEAAADLRTGRGIEWGRLRYAVTDQPEGA